MSWHVCNAIMHAVPQQDSPSSAHTAMQGLQEPPRHGKQVLVLCMQHLNRAQGLGPYPLNLGAPKM